MRAFVHIVLGYAFLLIVGGMWHALPFDVSAPDVGVVFATYLGITARNHLWQSTAAVVAIGYLADVLSGAPRGMSSLILGIVCILCRVVSARLLVRAGLAVAVFAFGAAILSGLMTLAIRAYFGVGVGAVWPEVTTVLGSALLTALVTLPIVRLCRLVDSRFARTEREREAAREGYLT